MHNNYQNGLVEVIVYLSQNTKFSEIFGLHASKDFS